jgi:hypothetical protein
MQDGSFAPTGYPELAFSVVYILMKIELFSATGQVISSQIC